MLLQDAPLALAHLRRRSSPRPASSSGKRPHAHTGKWQRWVAEGLIHSRRLIVQRIVGQALDLMDTYSNVPMSYADACLVCMVEARPRSRVFTLDADFRIYRQRNRRVIPLIAPFVQA